MYLRKNLNWKVDNKDTFITALILGRLHGESHRSSRYLSNRMPRTIATKPDYSIRWWKQHKCIPPERDVFSILKAEIAYRFDTGWPNVYGEVAKIDARHVAKTFPEYKGQVKLVVTSPPYLDTTHFEEDQWLRNWFLGGNLRPTKVARGDDRHTSKENYWNFLMQSWAGIADLLVDHGSTIVIRIGGSKISFDEACEGVVRTLSLGFKRSVELRSATESKIVGGQLRSFGPSAQGTKREFDIVASVHST